MYKNQIKRAVSVSVGLAAFAFLPQSGLATIVGSYVQNGNGTVTYSYVVDNTGGLFDLSAWSLDFKFSNPDWNQLDVLTGGDVGIPNANWFADAGTPVTGLSAQDFLSLSPAGDVLAGHSLSGFSFTSHFLPGDISFLEFSANGTSIGGTTIGPAVLAVPDAGGKSVEFVLATVAVLTAVRRGQRDRA